MNFNKKDCFNDYIQDVHINNIISELDEARQKADIEDLKPVTVRIDKDVLQTVDNIAGYLGVSRQKFLAELIDGGVGTALQALAWSEASIRSEREGKNEEEMDDFREEIRVRFIKELVV